MFGKVWFIFWCLIGIFILVPITQTIALNWTSENGTLASTFNASDVSSWNTTGQILTQDQVDKVGMTGLENVVTQFYVPAMMIFLAIIIFYVISKWTQNSRRGQ